MTELCRILAGLDVNAPRPTLTPAQRDALTESVTFDVPGVNGGQGTTVNDEGARGFGKAQRSFVFAGFPPLGAVRIEALEFLGMAPGGTCYVRHYTRFFQGDPGDTLTVTIAFNMDVLVDLEPIFLAVQEQELSGWKEGDAFD